MKIRIIIASSFVLILGLLAIINIPIEKNKTSEVIETTTTNEITTTTNTTITTKITIKTTKKPTTTRITSATKKGTYKLTHYGWDCKGCGGKTATGYDIRNTIYYNDATYGKLRIVAMKDLPFYSIIKIKNYDGRDIFAIVLDRGVGSGVIDLAVENEKKAHDLGKRENIEIEMLRSGR